MSIVIHPSEIQSLLPMPESVLQLNQVAFDPEVNPAKIWRIIELDPAMTADVLRWANSSWSAAQSPVVTIKDAVIRFGIANILQLAIGKHIAGPMKENLPGYRLEEKALWRHSVATALATECIGQITSRPAPPAAFTAALLHDIGKLILVRYLDRDVYGRIEKMIREEGTTYFEAEDRVLGSNHAKIGAVIAETWKLPPPIVNTIEHHHDRSAEPDPLLDTVQVANAVTKLLGIGLGTEEMNMDIDSEAALRLGLTPQSLETLCTLVNFKLQETETLWGIVS
jgi:putative nucleotidyltransferase with HDIG domain